VIQPIYGGALPFSGGLALVYLNGKYGFIDTKGNTVVQPIYGGALPFSGGLALVYLNGKWGYIDTKGTQYWED